MSWPPFPGSSSPSACSPPGCSGLPRPAPLYWIGVAFRWVLLPDSAAAAELGGEWRIGLALVVLVAWAVVGMLVAPALLRRMARRQSGTVVAAARERVLNRGY